MLEHRCNSGGHRLDFADWVLGQACGVRWTAVARYGIEVAIGRPLQLCPGPVTNRSLLQLCQAITFLFCPRVFWYHCSLAIEGIKLGFLPGTDFLAYGHIAIRSASVYRPALGRECCPTVGMGNRSGGFYIALSLWVFLSAKSTKRSRTPFVWGISSGHFIFFFFISLLGLSSRFPPSFVQ
jgi:hypothetical protein